MRRNQAIDGILLDRSDSLELVHQYDQDPANDFLVQEFFGTDFSRSYLALQSLQKRSSADLWPLLERRWDEEASSSHRLSRSGQRSAEERF